MIQDEPNTEAIHRMVSNHVLRYIPVSPRRAETLSWPLGFMTSRCKRAAKDLSASNGFTKSEKRVSSKILPWVKKLDVRVKNEIFDLKDSNVYANEIIQSWAKAEWFTNKPAVEKTIDLTVYKVSGETNTDDFSPAKEAWSRPDIPLHAQAFLKWSENISDPLEKLTELKKDNSKLAFVGDVVGTGSSRKSAANSVLWHMGDEIPYVPAKKTGGFCFGNAIAPIFYNTLQDSGAFPIELDVDALTHGRKIILKPYDGVICDAGTNEKITEFKLKSDVIFDEVRAGGRINLIIGRQLTDKTREKLGLEPSDVFQRYGENEENEKGFTLAQKMVGKACGMQGVRAGQYCEPRMTTVGSQDTT